MYITVVNHYCKPGMVEQASQRIDGSGHRMSTFKGFLFRYRAVNVEDPSVIVTVNGWETAADYEAWAEFRKGLPAPEGVSPLVKIVNEEYRVGGRILPPERMSPDSVQRYRDKDTR